MKINEINSQAVLVAAGKLQKDTPVVMLNLLRYKEQADYGDSAQFTQCSGMEAYLQRYVPAFNEVAAAEGVSGIQVNYIGAVVACIVCPEEERWDIIAQVEYPNFEAFIKVTQSPKYKADADPHRRAALDDWRLIATVKAQ